MSIATRTGDDGTTGLLYGKRVPKDHPQIEAVGTLDELNVAIGVALAHGFPPDTDQLLCDVQAALIGLMGEVSCAQEDAERYLASHFSRVEASDLDKLDREIASIETGTASFKDWATPGGNLRGAMLDQARVTARRAERQLVRLKVYGRMLRPVSYHFVNRVSDLLWLLAREAEKAT